MVQFLPVMDTECLPNQVDMMDDTSPSGKAGLIQSSRYVVLQALRVVTGKFAIEIICVEVGNKKTEKNLTAASPSH